jgi:hypothetical protein
LVSFALFWGLFPPSWFFIEYLALDNGAVVLPELDSLCREFRVNECSEQSARKALFDHVNTYAGLASRFWAAVSGALILIVGFGGRR